MGRKIRKCETVDEVASLLNHVLLVLDASGLKMTALHVDMARHTLMEELGNRQFPGLDVLAKFDHEQAAQTL